MNVQIHLASDAAEVASRPSRFCFAGFELGSFLFDQRTGWTSITGFRGRVGLFELLVMEEFCCKEIVIEHIKHCTFSISNPVCVTSSLAIQLVTETASPTLIPSISLRFSPTISISRQPDSPVRATSVPMGCSSSAGKIPTVV